MQMNTRENQDQVNSMKGSDSLLTEHSSLSLSYQEVDILILLTAETLLSRQEMEETASNGTSINNP
jgi:hypothetical protein